MGRSPLNCIHCRREFRRQSGADLFCGDDCRADHQTTEAQIVAELEAAGFARLLDTPNLFQRNDFHVSLQECKFDGVEKAILRAS